MTCTLSMGKLCAAASCSAIAILAAGSANAVTFSLGEIGQLTSTEPGATTVDFESGAPTTGTAVYKGDGQVVTGSVPFEYAKPYRLPDDTNYLKQGELESTGIDFTTPLTYFGLFFGSADDFNGISFYDGDQLVSNFTGGDILTADGVQDQDDRNRYVNFFAEGEETFDQVYLYSFDDAFETDNHAYKVVPEPSSALGVVALGVFGTGLLLKRKLRQKKLRLSNLNQLDA